MPANQIVHNTGGQNRFLDYVSLLPEFLRSEPDVVTLMQIFSDYLNNAYRNVEAATKYEFRLVAVEGMVGAVTAQLQKLADIFVQCANKEVPCLYMYLPENPASGIIEYAGTNPMVQLTTSIIPGGGSTNDRFYIDCVNLPEQSGVYIVTNVSTSDGQYKLALDSSGFSQDPFTKTADKPILTPAGYAPRMLQFYPSDITTIGSRRAEINENDVIYYEVYFSATITGISDVPSILREVTTIAGNEFPYLVDYYDHLGGHFPPQFTGGLFTVAFSPSVACSPFANGRGIFYARDLTEIDKQPRYLDPQGNNIYSDPEFLYRVSDPSLSVNLSNPPIPDMNQLNYSSDRNSNINFLKIHCSYVENPSITSGTYVVRLVVGDKSSSFNMASVNTITGAIVLSMPTTLKIGDTVQFIGTGTVPGGIVNDSTHVISSISSDGLSIYLSGVTFTSVGSGTGTINSITRTGDSVGVVDSLVSGVITYSSFIGNMITAGQFGVIIGNQIVSRIEVTLPDGINPIYIWSDTAHAYRAGSYVYYGCVYRVVRDTTFVNGTPDSESVYYASDMKGITTYGTETVYNPYMFGGYQGRSLAYNTSIDYNSEGFSTLGNEIIVQPGEKSGIAFRYPQREWIFNPTTANVRNLDRNGWIEVYSLYSPSNSDIANSASTQFVLSPTVIRANGRHVIFQFAVNHGYSVGQYVTVSGTSSYHNIIGTFPIIMVSDANTIVIECTESLTSGDTLIMDTLTVKNPNTVGNGTVMFAKQNLFDVSTLNPAYSEAGTWYMYTLNTIAWSRYTTFNPALYTNVLNFFPSDSGTYNISKLYGEQTVTVPVSSHNPLGTLALADGDLVLLQDQISADQNGYWRVKANESWIRIGTKLVMKVTDILVDAIEVGDLYNADAPYYYNRYSDSQVSALIASHKNVFAEQATQIQNYSLMMPSIDGIDTTTPLHKIYDARYDSNSVSPMPAFAGVPDMGYPIVEKIERLVYQKDPNVIDYALIAYLARYMGYDITPVADDVMSSQFYTSEEVRETAIRKVIQRLPEFNALKATEKGLEVLLLTFGIVGKVIKMWTDSKNPYGEFIPDYNVMDYRYTNMRDKIAPILYPTPHFAVQIEVEGNFPNELGIAEIGRLGTGIMKYKPINTVFEGIQAYMKLTAESSIYMSPMKATGKIQADIGFDVTFDEIIDAAPSVWNPITVVSTAYLIGLAPNIGTVNQSSTLQMIPIFSDGNVYNCTWSSSNPSVATVSSSGLLSAISVGTNVISCTYAGTTYQSGITVVTLLH